MAGKQPSNDARIARAPTETSDDENLNRFKTRIRMTWRMVGVTTGGIALVLAATAAAIFSGHAALVTGMWGRVITAAVLGALFVYAFATLVKYSIRPINVDSPRLVHYRMDSDQRTWRWSILINVFVMFFIASSLPRVLQVLRAAHQPTPLAGAVFAGWVLMYAFIMLLFAVLLSAGPGWPGARGRANDEFDSALRARMMRFGYILVMLLLGAVLLVALWRPDLTLTAVAWALYAGFAVPALYYFVADWRASRGDEG